MRSLIEVIFGANTSQFRRGVAQMENRVEKFGNRVKQVIGAAFVAFATRGAIRALGNIAAQIDNIGKIASKTGLGAREVQILSRVADKAGADINSVARAYSRFNRELQLGATAQTEQALARVGTSMEQIRGASPEETMRNLAKVINDIRDPAERSAVAVQLFGQRGEEMINVFKGLTAETEKYRTLSDQQVKDIEAMRDAWTELKAGIAASTAQVIAFFAATEAGKRRSKIEAQLEAEGFNPSDVREAVSRTDVGGSEKSVFRSVMETFAGKTMFNMLRPGGRKKMREESRSQADTDLGETPLDAARKAVKEAQEIREKSAQKERESEQATHDSQLEAIQFEREMLQIAEQREVLERRIARLKGEIGAEENEIARETLKLAQDRLIQQLEGLRTAEREKQLAEETKRLEGEMQAVTDALTGAQDPRNVVADSLQSIGGGGRASQSDEDFIKKLQERQTELSEQQVDLLRQIAEGGGMQ